MKKLLCLLSLVTLTPLFVFSQDTEKSKTYEKIEIQPNDSIVDIWVTLEEHDTIYHMTSSRAQTLAITIIKGNMCSDSLSFYMTKDSLSSKEKILMEETIEMQKFMYDSCEERVANLEQVHKNDQVIIDETKNQLKKMKRKRIWTGIVSGISGFGLGFIVGIVTK